MTNYEPPNYSQASRETLIERLYQIEIEQGLRGFETHPRYGLTYAEQTMLGILASRTETVSKESVYTLMYGMSEDPPEIKILDVWMCKIRGKLRPYDISIQTVWGRGWFVETADRDKINAMRIAPPELAEAA